MDINAIKFQPYSTSIGAGTKPQIPCDNMGVQMASEYQPHYSMGAYSRQIFSAANPTGITSTAFVSGTTTVFLGFGVSNPVGSTVNLHILKVGYSCMVPPAAAGTIVVGTGYNSGTNVTHTTPLTVRNNFIGVGATGVGLADSSFTLPTAPTTNLILGTLFTGAITTTPQIQFATDIEGSIILPPGGYMIIASLVAAGASGAFASASWMEIPV